MTTSLTQEEIAAARAVGSHDGEDWALETIRAAEQDQDAYPTPPADNGGWSEALINGLTQWQFASLVGYLQGHPKAVEWLDAYDTAAQAAACSTLEANRPEES